jgi:hypothetical protein
MNVGSTASLPVPGGPDTKQTIVLRTPGGEVIEVAQQVQLYAPNSLLKHPLVSPALSYLGGLPPLFFIAGDREVLRDEIIYACVLFFPHIFQLIDGLVGHIGLHTRSDFRCGMRRRICTRLSNTSRGTCGPRRCTFKFSMVYPHTLLGIAKLTPLPFFRRSSRSSRSLPVHNAWQILLPRCGLILQARYGRATDAPKPNAPQFQYFPDVSHAPERDAAGSFSKDAQVALVADSACCEYRQTTQFIVVTTGGAGDRRTNNARW